jgi:hypothetical protein
MKVRELENGTNLINIKVRLPDPVLATYQSYLGGEAEMWICGGMWGDFFLSPDPKEGHRRLYPMPLSVDPEDILEWEVVEVAD